MVYYVKCFFEISEYHCCILAFIHVEIPVTCTFKQASSCRVEGRKPRLLGKNKLISIKVVIKLIVKQLFENLCLKNEELYTIKFR